MNRLGHPWLLLILGAVLVGSILAGSMLGPNRAMAPGPLREQPTSSNPAAGNDGAAKERVRSGLAVAGYDNVPENIISTLGSLARIDDYPIYTMRYEGPYIRVDAFKQEYGATSAATFPSAAWACSLFAAVGDSGQPLMGRSFEWEYSPLLLVFLEPEDGHRSVMSVDIAYLVDEAIVDRLDEAPADQLIPLLHAPFLTFDGMNEQGLAIGMASVDYECGYPTDPDKRDVGDLRLMREVLENAATVAEALSFLDGINPVSQGGPNTHYLIADASCHAALIEYHQGEMHVFESSKEAPWQMGTNFPVVLAGGNPRGRCPRYALIEETLSSCVGDLTLSDAAGLLEGVSSEITQWSVVYDLRERMFYLAAGRAFESGVAVSVATGEVIGRVDMRRMEDETP